MSPFVNKEVLSKRLGEEDFTLREANTSYTSNNINLAAGDIVFAFQAALKEFSLGTESGKNLELYLGLKALGRTNNNQQVLSMVQS